MSTPPRFKLRPPGAPRRALGNLPLLLGLLALIAIVTAIGAWNQTRQPKADLTLTSHDLAKDPLAPSSPESGPGQTLPQALPGDAVSSPAATAVPTADPNLVMIRGSDVNIRQSPSRKAPVVARSRAGLSYRLSGERQRAEDLDWVGLTLEDGRKAWVSADFVMPVSAAPVAAQSAAAPVSAPVTPGDEVAAASQVVSQLLLAPGRVWPKADPNLRHLTVQALLHRIFKQAPARNTPDKAAVLDTCMSESSKDPSLQGLKVFELASACAIALKWR